MCRLSYCRNECATSADCETGLSCVLDADGLGACQRRAETSCTLASECPATLVCRFHQCTNACLVDHDCPGGAHCAVDPAGNACVDPSGASCTFDTECDVTGATSMRQRCIAGRCRQECFTDRDCRNDFWCNLSAGGACWPPPRPDAGPPVDAGARDGGGSDGGASVGPFPTTPAARDPHASTTTYVAALVGNDIVLSSLDSLAAPGGSFEILDTTTHLWRSVPFPQSREHMEWAVEGSVVYVTNGYYSTPGGDPLRDVIAFDVATDTITALGTSASEGRVSSTVAICDGILIAAGGFPNNPSSTGSQELDWVDLAMPSSSSQTSLSDPMRDLGVVVDGTHAYFAGGTHDLSGGSDTATDTLAIADCATRTLTPGTAMPHFYASLEGVLLGTRAYYVGARMPDGTSFITSSAITYDTIEVLDLATTTWSSISIPAPSGDVLQQIAAARDFVFVGGDTVVRALELSSGLWTRWNTDFRVEQLETDGTHLFVIGSRTTSPGDIVVDTYLVP